MMIEVSFSKIFFAPCVMYTLNLALKNIDSTKSIERNNVVYDE